ncbi:RloB family protein [Nocardia macrotermitis]|uniref:RloB family protein n=1 Tax=Nocardia macrotermitis TaxID=2585198 RepID=UPI001886146D|nr:RloB family protein [Nocardia macrotermitis]
MTELKRRTSNRQSDTTIQIITNGRQTELSYLKSLVSEYAQSAAVVCRRVKFVNGAPVSLVKKANAMILEGGIDFVYAVSDKDQFDIAQALHEQCDGVRLLISNPCFEAWLILHFEKCDSAIDGKHKALERLRRHLPRFDPNALDFTDFSPYVQKAADRARACGEAPLRNPSTTLWQLVDTLTRDSETN